MTNFEPDWDGLYIASDASSYDSFHLKHLRAIVAELRRQEQAAGWVLVRRDEIEAARDLILGRVQPATPRIAEQQRIVLSRLRAALEQDA